MEEFFDLDNVVVNTFQKVENLPFVDFLENLQRGNVVNDFQTTGISDFLDFSEK